MGSSPALEHHNAMMTLLQTNLSEGLTGLFRLPRDLRETMYHDAWTSSFSTFYTRPRAKPLRILATYKQSKCYERNRGRFMPPLLPPWVHADGIIARKAMDQFFQHCMWFALVAGNHLTTIVSIGVKPDTMQQRQWIAKESRYTEHLFDLMGYSRPENLLAIPKVDSSQDHIEIAKFAGQDLTLLKKMEPSLRGEQGAKILHVEFGLRIQKLTAKTTVDFSALEVPGFEIDALEVEVAIIGDEMKTAHGYLDKCLALIRRK